MIACLDVRANDAGDLVVTKGDQYDVRETDGEGREVPNFSHLPMQNSQHDLKFLCICRQQQPACAPYERP